MTSSFDHQCLMPILIVCWCSSISKEIIRDCCEIVGLPVWMQRADYTGLDTSFSNLGKMDQQCPGAMSIQSFTSTWWTTKIWVDTVFEGINHLGLRVVYGAPQRKLHCNNNCEEVADYRQAWMVTVIVDHEPAHPPRGANGLVWMAGSNHHVKVPSTNLWRIVLSGWYFHFFMRPLIHQAWVHFI